MVMGYFDDSGMMNQTLICMAGYLADDQNWTAMTNDWNVLLGKYGIPFLHLTDFLAAQGIYSELGWKKDEPRIREALDLFIFAIRKHTIAGVGVTLDANAYRSITKGVRKKEKPQVFCFERILWQVTKRLDMWKWSEPVCLIFDDSRDYAMQCYSNMWEIRTRHPELRKRIAGIAFGNDEYFAPLQAADLLSYATALQHRYGNGIWSEGSLFRNLLLDENPAYGKLYDGEHWDKESLDGQKARIIEVGNRQDIPISGRKRTPRG
jgi:hypothetical protein